MQAKITVGFHAPTWTENARWTMDGILRYLAEEPYIQIRDFRFSVSDENFAGSPPWRGKVDGVIVIAGHTPGVVEWLQRGEVPIVCAVGDLIGTGIPCFFPQSASLARLATDHAISGGFRHVAFVGTCETKTSEMRRAALETQLKPHGISLQALELLSIPNVNYDQQSDDTLQQAVRQLLASFQKPTLVSCFNDRIAAMVVREAQEMGLSIPEQVGVVGTGDTTIARLCDPPISSIRVNREETGYQAVRCLHQRIQGIELEQTTFEVPAIELVARHSTVGAKQTPTTDVQRALEYIQRHACDGVQLQTVADTVQVSLRTLELDFKKTTGRTMGDLIQQIRLDRAKHLLETTNLSTQRIANLVGFSHYSCLNRMTSRMLNMTPAQYRKRHLEMLKEV
ncbi:substrate-binding domain-containing protein [Blastopirellula sp. J2-11]|uniref:substrate-binding domain-containing protein n=1 Tax=Blastopirellula sp. J2-11 TaxID=2943192 RepID=UPI0021C5EDC4|nr:substrate-binding domain-containing protein [Blastopirellula sp. J2-11]UUO07987.1 substrate-binding domain-containing protein [Blastopirellula sp. J2-11]